MKNHILRHNSVFAQRKQRARQQENINTTERLFNKDIEKSRCNTELTKCSYHFIVILELKQNLQYRHKYIKLKHSTKKLTINKHEENSDKSNKQKAKDLSGSIMCNNTK